MAFRGVSAVNLDAKGRMAMPVRFRDGVHAASQGRMVVTIDITDVRAERCLLLYPLPDWEALEARIESLPNFDPNTRRIQRLLIGHAADVELDGSGRLLIPPMLREYASLTRKLVLVGQGRKIEIWAEEMWSEGREDWLQAGASEPSEALRGLTL